MAEPGPRSGLTGVQVPLLCHSHTSAPLAAERGGGGNAFTWKGRHIRSGTTTRGADCDKNWNKRKAVPLVFSVCLAGCTVWLLAS